MPHNLRFIHRTRLKKRGVLWLCFLGLGFHIVQSQSTTKVDIAVLGTFHFSQLHHLEKPNQNFFSQKIQEDIGTIIEKLSFFRPDQIYIEREPQFQHQIDSLYNLYTKGQLSLDQLEGGAGEVYQIAFALAKKLGLSAPKCVNHYESTSQSLLASGEHIEKYQNALRDFQNLGRTVVGRFLKGETTLLETLVVMNSPENIERSFKLLFNDPAYVKNGAFTSYTNIDETSIDKRYIGAEFISMFYERNLKIYSNLLNTQLKYGDARILLITGQTHVGVLQDLLSKNNRFKVTEAMDILTIKN